MTDAELDRIEAWCADPDADCVAIVDEAVPDLIAAIRRGNKIEEAAIEVLGELGGLPAAAANRVVMVGRSLMERLEAALGGFTGVQV